MISSPSATCPARLPPAALKSARDAADSFAQRELAAAQNKTAQAMAATAWVSNVQ
jgi:hypothetical protein